MFVPSRVSSRAPTNPRVHVHPSSDSDGGSHELQALSITSISQPSHEEVVRLSHEEIRRPRHEELGPPVSEPAVACDDAVGSAAEENPQTDGPGATQLKPLTRGLDAIHIFMIAINAVVGVGYFVKTGLILRTGGPGAVIYSYLFLGLLSMMVMRSLTVMLRVWPVTGALELFVSKFVDKHVGIVVAFLYWLTFCFSFAGLTTAIGSLVESLPVPEGASIAISVVSIMLPVGLNLTSIRVFRKIELVLGFSKLALLLSVIILMNVINPEAGEHAFLETPRNNTEVMRRHPVFQHEGDAPGGYFTALVSCIFIASFSYVGIEIVAGTAQEARFRGRGEDTAALPTQGSQPDTAQAAERREPFSYAMWVPIATAIIYVWGGWIVSENVYWKDDRLPSSVWTEEGREEKRPKDGTSRSIFILVLADAGLDQSRIATWVLTSLLIAHVLSTSTSSLYVASRTLFGLAYNAHDAINMTQHGKWKTRCAAWLAASNGYNVPYVAVLVSAILCCWLPFLKYTSVSFLDASELITQLSSVCCLLVWAFTSLAAFRFLYKFRAFLPNNRTSSTVKLAKIIRVETPSWYYLHLAISALSFTLCLLVITVGGAMAIVHNPNGLQAASFSGVVFFIISTFVFKLFNGKLSDAWYTKLDEDQMIEFIGDINTQVGLTNGPLA